MGGLIMRWILILTVFLSGLILSQAQGEDLYPKNIKFKSDSDRRFYKAQMKKIRKAKPMRTITTKSKPSKVKNSVYDEMEKRGEEFLRQSRREAGTDNISFETAKANKNATTRPAKPIRMNLKTALETIEKQKAEIQELKARIAALEAAKTPTIVESDGSQVNATSAKTVSLGGVGTVTPNTIAQARLQAREKLDRLYDEYAAVKAEYIQVRGLSPDEPGYERYNILRARKMALEQQIKEAGQKVESLR
jgi:hypothetical protein